MYICFWISFSLLFLCAGTYGSHPNHCARCNSDGCIGGSRCQLGYQDAECARCIDGYQESSSGGTVSCSPCSGVNVGILLGAIILMVIFAAFLLYMNGSEKFRPSLQMLRICITYFQGKKLNEATIPYKFFLNLFLNLAS